MNTKEPNKSVVYLWHTTHKNINSFDKTGEYSVNFTV